MDKKGIACAHLILHTCEGADEESNRDEKQDHAKRNELACPPVDAGHAAPHAVPPVPCPRVGVFIIRLPSHVLWQGLVLMTGQQAPGLGL